uniref:Uncharacterized protein n=1 Tax=Panagrolaimus superbus TaxID=310955 RepID=A0A914YGU1_9BILA
MDRRFHEAVANFRNGTTNVMIATQILEEGIDIRTCNLVIRANVPSNFTSYIQSRGRARFPPSMYAMIVSQSEKTEVLYNLNVYKRNERLLIERMYAFRNTVPERADRNFDIHLDDLFPAYSTPSGATVTLSNAIGLINRYCARLPSDVFTRLAVKIETQRVSGGYLSKLLFPINSPVKEEIKGKICPAIKLAEMNVALEACKILHQREELDDKLLPLTKDKVASMLELSDEFGDFASNVPRETGSAKKRRLYPRRVAKALNNVLPMPGEAFYVYLIELDLVEPITEQSNPKKRKIINPKDTPYIFGLCTKAKLPKIPAFPVYQRQGKILANIKLHSKQFTLNEEELELVKTFHSYIFEEILGMKNEMHFQPEIASFSTLLIPLKRSKEEINFEMDFDILCETVKGFPVRPSDEERKKFLYIPERYHDAVVKPWYRPNEREAYYIGEIKTGFYPSSSFADPKFETFNKYFAEKYGLEVYNQEQQLLDVDNTSNRMNLLLPRVTQQRAIRRANDHSQKQFMIPELVSIHPMPASFWIMVIELPTILFRMNCLLLADEFRSKVASAALSIESEPIESFTWPQLQYPIPANNVLSVKNLDQLKRANAEDDQMEDEIKKNKVEEKEAVSSDEIPMDFQIGVWDPTLGDKFRDTPLNTPEEADIKKPQITPVDDDLSSDDEQWTQVNIDVVDFGTENVNPVTANLNIDNFPVLGWDDVSVPEAQAASQAQIAISSSSGINVSALLHDIESITPGQPVRRTRLQAKDMGANAVDMMDENDRIAKVIKRINKDEEDTLNIYMDKLPEQIITESDLAFVQVNKEEMLDAEKNLNEETIKENIEFFNEKPICERINVPQFPESMESWFFQDKTSVNPYGVPPTLLLQALTTSSASDGFNLERLETIGDSFLKLSVTNYLYQNLPHQHEGNLSFIRSREVSNANLFHLGKTKGIPCLMECSKFEPSVNWLPPGYGTIGSTFEPQMNDGDDEENNDEANGWGVRNENEVKSIDGVETIYLNESKGDDLLPYSYNYLSQQYISDKAIADCVEALIGAHLIALGPSKTLDFMKWLGIKVLIEKPKLKSETFAWHIEVFLPILL